MAQALAQFSITKGREGYLLRIEDDGGTVVELTATYDQLDLISEEIDEQLDEDEDEALAIDEDDEQ